jgi:hypothetical protein
MIILVVIESIFALKVLLHIFTDDNGKSVIWQEGWPFVFLYPFAAMISPLTGFLAVSNTSYFNLSAYSV